MATPNYAATRSALRSGQSGGYNGRSSDELPPRAYGANSHRPRRKLLLSHLLPPLNPGLAGSSPHLSQRSSRAAE